MGVLAGQTNVAAAQKVAMDAFLKHRERYEILSGPSRIIETVDGLMLSRDGLGV